MRGAMANPCPWTKGWWATPPACRQLRPVLVTTWTLVATHSYKSCSRCVYIWNMKCIKLDAVSATISKIMKVKFGRKIEDIGLVSRILIFPFSFVNTESEENPQKVASPPGNFLVPDSGTGLKFEHNFKIDCCEILWFGIMALYDFRYFQGLPFGLFDFKDLQPDYSLSGPYFSMIWENLKSFNSHVCFKILRSYSPEKFFIVLAIGLLLKSSTAWELKCQLKWKWVALKLLFIPKTLLDISLQNISAQASKL